MNVIHFKLRYFIIQRQVIIFYPLRRFPFSSQTPFEDINCIFMIIKNVQPVQEKTNRKTRKREFNGHMDIPCELSHLSFVRWDLWASETSIICRVSIHHSWSFFFVWFVLAQMGIKWLINVSMWWKELINQTILCLIKGRVSITLLDMFTTFNSTNISFSSILYIFAARSFASSTTVVFVCSSSSCRGMTIMYTMPTASISLYLPDFITCIQQEQSFLSLDTTCEHLDKASWVQCYTTGWQHRYLFPKALYIMYFPNLWNGFENANRKLSLSRV